MHSLSDLLDYWLWPKATGYDVPKTLTYGLILTLVAWLAFEIFKRLRIRVDEELAVALTPWVIFGGVLRVLSDAGVVSGYLFVTPGIWFFIFGLAFITLLISRAWERRAGTPCAKPLFVVGALLVSVALLFVRPVNWWGGVLVLAFYLPCALPFAVIRWDLANRAVVLVHTLDAITTFVALQFFGYAEQHVLPTFFIELWGPVSFIPLKLTAILSFLWFVDRFSEDAELNRYLKLIVGILGGATASRDFTELLTLAQLR